MFSYHIVEEAEVEMFKADEDEAPPSFEDGNQSIFDELKEINLGTPEEPQPTFISESLTHEEESEYINLVTSYRDIFTWSYKEMLRLDPKVVVYHLTIKEGYQLVK